MFEDLEEFGFERDLNNDDLNSNDIEQDPNLVLRQGGDEPLQKQAKAGASYMNDAQLDWHLRLNLTDEFGDGADGKSRRLAAELQKAMDLAIRKLQLVRNSVALATNASALLSKRVDKDVHALNIFKYPPRNTVFWSSLNIKDETFYTLIKPDSFETKQFELELQRKLSNVKTGNTGGLVKNFAEIIIQAQDMMESKVDNEQQVQTMDIDYMLEISDQALWVEKYRARVYTDLLSDDGINRILLTWLKLWDECVFKTQPKPKPVVPKFNKFIPLQNPKNNDASKGPFNTKPPFKKMFFNADDLPVELDHYKRPFHKVALLCGPPGVGKTTLAHVCARHCGYFACEMNASDDRTLDAFKKQLDVITQMSKTLDQNAKPHCLIIDEIDGAPAASINFLIGKLKNVDAEEKEQNKTNSAPKSVLKRPIICICNDLYVPALAELRKIALVLHVPPLELRRLANRLTNITKRESLLCDSACFEVLCEKTERDVRSCLNTLQFLSLDQKKKNDADNCKQIPNRIYASELKNRDLGAKDMHKSLFAVWNDVFRLPKFTRKRHHDAFEAINHTSISARFNNIGNIVDTCGEMDKVTEGVFANYLGAPFKDHSMELINAALNWLQSIDHLNRHIDETQCYDFYIYKRYVPIIFHLCFATAYSPQFKIQYPHMFFECNSKRQRWIGFIQKILDEMQPLLRPFSNFTSLMCDTFPYLTNIIQPELKPINSQLYSEKEKNDLNKVVNVMLDYNLTYRQERGLDGRYDFVLEPSIDEMIRYPLDAKNRFGQQQQRQNLKMPYVAKQLVAREVEVRRGVGKECKAVVKPKEKTMEKESIFASQKTSGQPMINVYLGKSSNNQQGMENSVNQRANLFKVWFRYNEGSMSAVKRNLKISDLL